MTDATTAMTALSDALLTLTRHDKRPPCAHDDRWTSDDRDQRDSAVRQCQSCCPLITLCRDYADQIRVSFGVFGAHDYTKTRQRHARRQATPT
jgi:Transcription factor WhiB